MPILAHSEGLIGACLGSVCVFVIGYALGRLIGWVYNWSSAPKT